MATTNKKKKSKNRTKINCNGVANGKSINDQLFSAIAA